MTTTTRDTIHTLPVLMGGRGPLHGSEMPIRVTDDGVACHPMTSGPGRAQQECNIYSVTRVNGPLRGWGIHDGEYHYELGAAKVGGLILEKFARRTGLMMPEA